MQYYNDYITDVALDISQSSYWRKILFSSDYGQNFLISKANRDKIPAYVLEPIESYDLKFYVSKVNDSPEEFDEGFIIFKFESCEFPEIIRYSGNNEQVI